MSRDAWQLLDFDSEFFACRIARVTLPPRAAAEAAELASAADRAEIDCLVLLLDAGELDGLRASEDAGFRVVDLRLTISKSLSGDFAGPASAAAPAVRLALPDDLPGLQAIARESHHDSRFYADPNFPRERCDALYARWIERKCAGGAAAVFAVGAPGSPQGYLSCDLPDATCGQLDLLAVAPAARGHGCAAALTAHALAWMRSQGRQRARLVTQGRNTRALQHFGRFGFAAERIELWLHRWRTPRGASV